MMTTPTSAARNGQTGLVIAAAGAHNLLMLGPPGSGRTEHIPQLPTLDPAAHYWLDTP